MWARTVLQELAATVPGDKMGSERTPFPRIITVGKARAILKRIYEHGGKRPLFMPGHLRKHWLEREQLPGVGESAVLIQNTHSPDVLEAVVATLRRYYTAGPVRLIYVQEEFLQGSDIVAIEYDRDTITHWPAEYLRRKHVNGLLLDSLVTWVLKLFHEDVGILSGPSGLLQFFKTITVAKRIQDL